MNFRQMGTGKKLLIGAGLLIVIFLVVVGISLNSKTSNTTSPSAGVSGTTDGSTKVQYFTIKQWKVRAPQNNKLNLQYEIQTDLDNPSRYAEFDSTQLVAADPVCAKHGGAIQRYKDNDRVVMANLPAKIYFESQPQSSYSYADGYYYTYVAPLIDCSTNPQAVALQQQTAAAVKDFVKNLENDPTK